MDQDTDGGVVDRGQPAAAVFGIPRPVRPVTPGPALAAALGALLVLVSAPLPNGTTYLAGGEVTTRTATRVAVAVAGAALLLLALLAWWRRRSRTVGWLLLLVAAGFAALMFGVTVDEATGTWFDATDGSARVYGEVDPGLGRYVTLAGATVTLLAAGLLLWRVTRMRRYEKHARRIVRQAARLAGGTPG